MIVSLLFPGISYGQNIVVDSALYEQYANDFDLSSTGLSFVITTYRTRSVQPIASTAVITNIVMGDGKASDAIYYQPCGFWSYDTGAKVSVLPVYTLYDGTTDTFYLYGDNTVFSSLILPQLDNYGLGTAADRQAAYNDLKGIVPGQPEDPSEEGQGEPLDVVPLVSVDLMSILAPIADFVKSGFGFSISVIYLSLIIYNVFLNRKKSIIKSEKRENRSIAQDFGVSTRRVSRLRDDYQVYRDNYGGSMSFRDYVELDKNNRIGASRRV